MPVNEFALVLNGHQLHQHLLCDAAPAIYLSIHLTLVAIGHMPPQTAHTNLNMLKSVSSVLFVVLN